MRARHSSKTAHEEDSGVMLFYDTFVRHAAVSVRHFSWTRLLCDTLPRGYSCATRMWDIHNRQVMRESTYLASLCHVFQPETSSRAPKRNEQTNWRWYHVPYMWEMVKQGANRGDHSFIKRLAPGSISRAYLFALGKLCPIEALLGNGPKHSAMLLSMPHWFPRSHPNINQWIKDIFR